VIHKYRNNKNLANSKILGKVFTNLPKSSNKHKKKIKEIFADIQQGTYV
jgi:hypothetical protein